MNELIVILGTDEEIEVVQPNFAESLFDDILAEIQELKDTPVSQGVKGDKGDDGDQGLQGVAGAAGADGASGLKGDDGDQGLQGVAGAAGADGASGLKGDDGDQGLQGVAGGDGASCLKGDDGDQGLQGVAGASGSDGLQGLTGTAGNQGIQGIQGQQGIQGIQGETGAEGSGGSGGIAYYTETFSGYVAQNATNWYTSSDDYYGTSDESATETAGTGVDPIYEWENMGQFIREGTIIHGFDIFGRMATNSYGDDMEYILAYVKPVDAAAWLGGTGVDNDSEIIVTELYRGFWLVGGSGQAASPSNLNDQILRKIPLSFTAPNDGQLRVYVKELSKDPRGSTSTTYFYQNISWLLSYAVPV